MNCFRYTNANLSKPLMCNERFPASTIKSSHCVDYHRFVNSLSMGCDWCSTTFTIAGCSGSPIGWLNRASCSPRLSKLFPRLKKKERRREKYEHLSAQRARKHIELNEGVGNRLSGGCSFFPGEFRYLFSCACDVFLGLRFMIM